MVTKTVKQSKPIKNKKTSLTLSYS